MIKINDKKDCCGCNACVQKCPASCMAMLEDQEGFLYPQIDTKLCTNCGLCEKVCPVINQSSKRKPLYTCAAKNKNETIRKDSSSGGVFSLLAEYVLSQKGIVFGAHFNESWEVIHDYTENIAGLAAFRGSKYVQSKIENSFVKAEQFLKSDRIVLFSGTPCQIKGLRLFLQCEYENLLTVDFVCHGVPSPKVWRMYLQELVKSTKFQKETAINFSLNDITNIEFRSKSSGWKRFSFLADMYMPEKNFTFSEPLDKNIFMRGFLSDLYLRPSCYACPSKCFKSGSNITVGDYWGIEHLLPEYDDDKGISLVMLHTSKAFDIYRNMDADSMETLYENAFSSNPAIEKSAKIHKNRKSFFSQIDNNKKSIFALIETSLRASLGERIKRWAKRMLK
ncbi:MAG: Coenzyme F420 hydrogenase/dehydrogenase, beta subunit C-terminal domain [Bacteroidales bacterium]|jgi:NAD-dependent dihydropyrimidine dehydrogenase PreA subunit|nr:Coenzyme F420 hydrogenase/dehydrogenase, beta subunit C-terminal domain [Bacteroidales bacterium]